MSHPIVDIANAGLSVRQLAVLIVLADVGAPLKHRDLRRRVGCAGGALTRAIETLSEKGFAKTKRGTDDKRDVFVNATETGAELVARLM